MDLPAAGGSLSHRTRMESCTHKLSQRRVPARSPQGRRRRSSSSSSSSSLLRKKHIIRAAMATRWPSQIDVRWAVYFCGLDGGWGQACLVGIMAMVVVSARGGTLLGHNNTGSHPSIQDSQLYTPVPFHPSSYPRSGTPPQQMYARIFYLLRKSHRTVGGHVGGGQVAGKGRESRVGVWWAAFSGVAGSGRDVCLMAEVTRWKCTDFPNLNNAGEKVCRGAMGRPWQNPIEM